MSSENDDEVTRIERLQQRCEQIGIEAMVKVQAATSGDETEFQYALCLVLRQVNEHLGLSLAARQVKEEFMLGRN